MVVSLVPFLSLMTTPSQDASPSTHPAIVNAIVESLASSHDDETFHATHANVTLQTADQSTSIPGTLVLTTRRLLFVPLDMDITTPTRSGGVVIAVPFRAIAVHAIARDHDSGGHCHELTVHQAHVQVWIDDVEVDVPGLPAAA